MSDKEIYAIECELEVALSRLIGYLAIMTGLNTYKKIHKELCDLLKIVIKWGADFEIKRDLNFIQPDEILNVYNRMEKIKDDYLYDSQIGIESELSDKIVIWMFEVMKLRKKLIEVKGVE